jgi:replicative superfamily II helicase
MSKKENKIGFGKIVLTAVITALITTVSQTYLQSRELDKELSSWKEKYNIESIDKINDTRIRMLENVNEQLLQLEIQAKEIKLEVAVSKYYTKPEQGERLTELMVQYNKDLYRNASKMHIASLFFGNKVDSLIPLLGKSLNQNFQHNLMFDSNRIKLPELEFDFETTDSLTNMRNIITQQMAKEIMESYELKR